MLVQFSLAQRFPTFFTRTKSPAKFHMPLWLRRNLIT